MASSRSGWSPSRFISRASAACGWRRRASGELQGGVDTLIVIPNQNLFRIANEKTTFTDAFAMADQVLYSGVACITDLMVKEGLINLDFADVRTVMREMGKAMMGTGEASGDKRASLAAEAAISNPLLDESSMRGARGLLISITGGRDLTLFEVDEAATRIREEVDPDANIILGATFEEALEGVIRVSVVATGIDTEAQATAAVEARMAEIAERAKVPPRSPTPKQRRTVVDPYGRTNCEGGRVANRGADVGCRTARAELHTARVRVPSRAIGPGVAGGAGDQDRAVRSGSVCRDRRGDPRAATAAARADRRNRALHPAGARGACAADSTGRRFSAARAA